MTSLEVLFTPADFSTLKERDLSQTTCVVFDVLRATSSMVTALANGAASIIPVKEIPEALAVRKRLPDALLAGERDGVLIPAELTGSVAFDLGNSPIEFTVEKVRDKTIAMSTTNGTRALRACAHAQHVFISCFLNLSATVEHLRSLRPGKLLLVCGGTYEQVAYEDILCAGAICDMLWSNSNQIADSALAARKLFLLEQNDLPAAVSSSRNGRRLLSRSDLRDDVAFCSRLDCFPLVAKLQKDGSVWKLRL